MSIYNPNRFVTGLTDIHYVRQVNRIQSTHRENLVIVVAPLTEPLVIKEPPVIEDRFIRDHSSPENLSNND